ncbi:fimbrial protein [Pseudomonas lactis]|uniref:Fimbrial protein n=1 Tax=Pseudomonas lactis TaxID=1615674 RepID=I4K5T9_9PSED|nr:fimbrial protein [Pseudomonas lactis]EIK60079.1 fimbrial protein [Pseudomonas lactis]
MNSSLCFFSTLFTCLISDITLADCKLGDGAVNQTFNIGAQHVPRDAPVGSVIGTAEMSFVYTYTNALLCTNNDTLEVRGSNWAIILGINVPLFQTNILKAPVVKTNIPGVGMIVSVEEPMPENRSIESGIPPYPPYKLIARLDWGKINYIRRVEFKFTLVKTDNNIPSGASEIVTNSPATYIQSGAQRSIGVFLAGTVIRSECSVAGGHANINVPMGDVMRRNFKGKYSHLESKDFTIPLTNCVAGRYPTGQEWNYYQNSSAHIKFEGVQGSSIIEASKGILGLTQESTAKGVAVQVLRKDGITPLPIGQEVSVASLSGSNMNIELKARYIQISDSLLGPEPGKADARAAFTVTYK